MAYTGKDALMAPDGDAAIYQGDLLAISGADAIRQQWLIRVRTWQGEWVLDTEHGVPYRQEIFTKTASPARVEEIFRNITLQTPGVLSVESVVFEIVNEETREISVEVNATIDGPEGITFQYKGDLPLGASSGLFPANFPNTLSDLRIWLDAQDLDNLTYNSPLTLSNKAGTGEAAGDCILDGVSDLNLKRSALFDRSTEEKLAIADTQAIRHGTGEISMLSVVKRSDSGETSEKDFGILTLDGYNDTNDTEEFYTLAARGDDSTPNSTSVVLKSHEILRTFKLFSGDSGVSNLSQSLTLDSQTQTPTFWYVGQDATTSAWPAVVGQDSAIAGAGNDVIPDDGAPFTDSTDAVRFDSGKYFEVDDTDFGNIETDDFVICCVCRKSGTGRHTIISKKDGSGIGWEIFFNAGLIYFSLKGTTGPSVSSSVVVDDNTWNFICVTFKFQDRIQLYLNGVYQTGINIPTVTSPKNTAKLSIGSKNGTYTSDDAVSFAALWKAESWLSSAVQDAEMLELSQRLSGFYPAIAAGSAEPLVMSRASSKYGYIRQTDDSLRLFKLGGNWLSFVSRKDDNGDEIKGYSSEIQSTNLFTESEDFTAWTLVDAGDTVTDDDATGPDGQDTAASLVADSTDGQHGVTTAVTLTAAKYAFSVFAKPGNKDWIKLEDSTAAVSAYFDVANGAVGTTSGTVQALIDGPYLGGYYRCQIIYTGTAAAHTLEILSAHADTDDTFAGDGSTVNTYIAKAQAEAGDLASSPIDTDGATATRLKDEIQFVAGANIGGEDVGQGTVKFDWWLPDFTADTNRVVAVLSDGGSNSNRVRIYQFSTLNYLIAQSAASLGNPGTALGPASGSPDGDVHQASLIWETDDFVMCDGLTKGGPDTSCDMPDDLDRLDIGIGNTSAGQFTGGILSNIRIYPYTEPEEAFTVNTLPNFDSAILQIDIDSSGNVTMYKDGVAVALDPSSTTAITNRLLNGDGYVSADLDIYTENTPENFLEGNVGEILVYARNLSDTERDELTEWLKEKWGI